MERVYQQHALVEFCYFKLVLGFVKNRKLLIIPNSLGDVESLREKILSIPQHLTNNHVFPNNKKHLKCSHGDLSQEDRNKPWLQDNSKVKEG